MTVDSKYLQQNNNGIEADIICYVVFLSLYLFFIAITESERVVFLAKQKKITEIPILDTVFCINAVNFIKFSRQIWLLMTF